MAITLVAPGNGDTVSFRQGTGGNDRTLGQSNCSVGDVFIVFGGNKGSASTGTGASQWDCTVPSTGGGTTSTPEEWHLPSFPYDYGTASINRSVVAWWFRITSADIDTGNNDLVEVNLSVPDSFSSACINVWRGVGTTDFSGTAGSNSMVGLQSQTDKQATSRTFTWFDSGGLGSTPWSSSFFDGKMTILAMGINDRGNWDAPNLNGSGQFPSNIWNSCIYGNGTTTISRHISGNQQSSVMMYADFSDFASANAATSGTPIAPVGMNTPLELPAISSNTPTSSTEQVTLWMAFKEDASGVAVALAASTVGTSVTSAALSASQAVALASSTVGTSVTSAALSASQAVALAASTAGTSVASAALSASQAVALSASTAGTSVASAAMNSFAGVSLASSTVGTSVATAALSASQAVALASSTVGTSTATAALSAGQSVALLSSTVGTSTATADLTAFSGVSLTASTVGTSTATAALSASQAVALVASTVGTSTASAALSAGNFVNLASSTAGTSVTSAALSASQAVALASSTVGTSTATAALSAGQGVALASSTVGTSTATAALSAIQAVLLAASTVGTSVATAVLSASQAVALVASTAGSSTATAELTTGQGKTLAASTVGTSVATAALSASQAVALAASTTGSSTVTAELTRDLVAVRFSASVTGTSGSTAAISASQALALAASATGTSTLTAALVIVTAEPLLKLGVKSLLEKTQLTEEITYYPGGDLSAGVVIRAVVVREELDYSDYGEFGSPTMDVSLYISTQAANGIATVAAGKDLADVVVIEGESAVRVRITEVVERDPAMSQLVGVR